MSVDIMLLLRHDFLPFYSLHRHRRINSAVKVETFIDDVKVLRCGWFCGYE